MMEPRTFTDVCGRFFKRPASGSRRVDAARSVFSAIYHPGWMSEEERERERVQEGGGLAV